MLNKKTMQNRMKMLELEEKIRVCYWLVTDQRGYVFTFKDRRHPIAVFTSSDKAREFMEKFIKIFPKAKVELKVRKQYFHKMAEIVRDQKIKWMVRNPTGLKRYKIEKYENY